MNWIMILLLSGVGIVLGIAALFGATGWIEWVLWLAAGGLCGILIASNVNERLFMHGLVAGALGGFWGGIIHTIFFRTFAENNPAEVARFKEVGTTGAMPLLILQTAGMSILAGICFGIVAVVAGKFISPDGDEIIEPAPPARTEEQSKEKPPQNQSPS
jgi:hypothetical protein